MADASTTKVFTIGLTSLKAGEVASNGEMQTTLSQHGNVYRDTLEISTAETTFEDYFEEENDQPVASFATAGDTTLSWEILRPSPADLVYWAGGSVDSSTGKVWSAPTSYTAITKAIQINSKQGYVIEFPKCQIAATVTGGGQKSTPMRLAITAKVLVPSYQGTDKPPMILTEPS